MSRFATNLGIVARELVRTDKVVKFCQIGDSTSAPGNTPRFGRSVIRGWQTAIAARTWYGLSGQAGDEGYEIFDEPPAVAVGASIGGAVVPPGFDCRGRTFVAPTAFQNQFRFISTSLTNYKSGHPWLGGAVRVQLAALRVPNPLQNCFYVYTDVSDTVADGWNGFTVPTGLPAGATPEWVRVDLPATTNTVKNEARLGLALMTRDDEVHTGRTVALGGIRIERVGAGGLDYSAIAFGGARVFDHLPQHINGASVYSNAERKAKFDVFGWPDVIGVSMGINMTSEESNDVGGVWGANVRALLQWHRELYAANGKKAPLFLLMTPHDGNITTRLPSIENELAEIATEWNDVGVLNVHRLILHRHGARASWAGTLLGDNVHQSAAGADEFGLLAWSAIESAAGDIGGGVLNDWPSEAVLKQNPRLEIVVQDGRIRRV
jgi:hypothetical protein